MLNDLINLFFPSTCRACSHPLVQGEAWLCTYCAYELPQTHDHLVLDNLVAQRLYGRLPVRQATAFCQFRKGSRIQKLLHALKYDHQPKLGVALGKRYGALLRQAPWLQAVELIVPVPLHAARMRQRGYNQSACIAAGLAASLAIPWSDRCLYRTINTATQTKKDRLSRFRNVEKAFSATPQSVQGKHVLLVDDVVTTGATLEACGAALFTAGVREMSVAALAVAN